MPPRKERIPVVFDTNVVLGYFLSRSSTSPNVRVFQLWHLRRELQLVVSAEVIVEYLEILERHSALLSRVARFKRRLSERGTVTFVTPGPHPAISRDPDDDVMIAAAIAGRAGFLITNDRDLLDIAEEQKRKYRFEIVTPAQFLAQWSP